MDGIVLMMEEHRNIKRMLAVMRCWSGLKRSILYRCRH